MANLLNECLCFKRALKLNMIKENPAKFAEFPMFDDDDLEDELDTVEGMVWSIEEMNHFLEISKNERMHDAFYLMLRTGMRRGEVLALNWNNDDLDNKILTIRRAVRRDEEGRFYIGRTKTRSSNRAISISENGIEV